jgi:hypothetical protein
MAKNAVTKRTTLQALQRAMRSEGTEKGTGSLYQTQAGPDVGCEYDVQSRLKIQLAETGATVNCRKLTPSRSLTEKKEGQNA